MARNFHHRVDKNRFFSAAFLTQASFLPGSIFFCTLVVKHPARETIVQSLSVAARACGVEPVRQDAGRPKVQELIGAIRRSAGPETAQRKMSHSGPNALLSIPSALNMLHAHGTHGLASRPSGRLADSLQKSGPWLDIGLFNHHSKH